MLTADFDGHEEHETVFIRNRFLFEASALVLWGSTS
jgi:hypothetical protein